MAAQPLDAGVSRLLRQGSATQAADLGTFISAGSCTRGEPATCSRALRQSERGTLRYEGAASYVCSLISQREYVEIWGKHKERSRTVRGIAPRSAAAASRGPYGPSLAASRGPYGPSLSLGLGSIPQRQQQPVAVKGKGNQPGQCVGIAHSSSSWLFPICSIRKLCIAHITNSHVAAAPSGKSHAAGSCLPHHPRFRLVTRVTAVPGPSAPSRNRPFAEGFILIEDEGLLDDQSDEGLESPKEQEKEAQPKEEWRMGFTKHNELFVGRVAMLGFMASLVGEALTGKGTLAQFDMETGIPVYDAEPLLLFFILFSLVAAVRGLDTNARLSFDVDSTDLPKHRFSSLRAFLGLPEQGPLFAFSSSNELFVGRMAQLGFACALIGEIVTGKGALAQLGFETGLPVTEIEPLLVLSIAFFFLSAVDPESGRFFRDNDIDIQ